MPVRIDWGYLVMTAKLLNQLRKRKNEALKICFQVKKCIEVIFLIIHFLKWFIKSLYLFWRVKIKKGGGRFQALCMELTTHIKSLLEKSETDVKVVHVYNNNSAHCPWGEACGSVGDFGGLFAKWCFSNYIFFTWLDIWSVRKPKKA